MQHLGNLRLTPPYLQNISLGLCWNLCRNRSVFIFHYMPLKHVWKKKKKKKHRCEELNAYFKLNDGKCKDANFQVESLWWILVAPCRIFLFASRWDLYLICLLPHQGIKLAWLNGVPPVGKDCFLFSSLSEPFSPPPDFKLPPRLWR